VNQRGLTLVEVLVALGIFALVNTIALGAFRVAANGSDQLAEAEARIGEIERLRGLLRQDLDALVARPVLEADADVPRPALSGGRALEDILPSEEQPLLALVRSGWANPGAKQPRAELQAVTYLVEDRRLIRRTRPFLDAARDTPFADGILLDGVGEVEIRFREAGRWREEAGTMGRGERPLAVRLTLTHPVYGEIEMVFLVPKEAV
jgi:general secretion pathway protein J